MNCRKARATLFQGVRLIQVCTVSHNERTNTRQAGFVKTLDHRGPAD